MTKLAVLILAVGKARRFQSKEKTWHTKKRRLHPCNVNCDPATDTKPKSVLVAQPRVTTKVPFKLEDSTRVLLSHDLPAYFGTCRKEVFDTAVD